MYSLQLKSTDWEADFTNLIKTINTQIQEKYTQGKPKQTHHNELSKTNDRTETNDSQTEIFYNKIIESSTDITVLSLYTELHSFKYMKSKMRKQKVDKFNIITGNFNIPFWTIEQVERNH